MSVLAKGQRNVEILKQPQYSPLSVEKQVAIIYLGTNGLLKDVPVDKVKEFEEDFLTQLESRHQDVLDTFRAGKLDDSALETVRNLAADISGRYA
jgi:F-type H+-transporting ATPase subunit alpha